MDEKYGIAFIFFIILFSCKEQKNARIISQDGIGNPTSKNVLDFRGSPNGPLDRNMLMFSDQGSWFAYSLPDSLSQRSGGGFSGPYLMTQQNGVWIGTGLTQLQLTNASDGKEAMDWQQDLVDQTGYASHLEQHFENKQLKVQQQLVFLSGHSALQRTRITNKGNSPITMNSNVKGDLFSLGIHAEKEGNRVKLVSTKTDAVGYVQLLHQAADIFVSDSLHFTINNQTLALSPNESVELLSSQTFIFPEYSWEEEKESISKVNFDSVLQSRKQIKAMELSTLDKKKRGAFKDDRFTTVLAKAQLTLQNNWRIPAGELKHQGLFPSYHYKWFHGFWSWDSWKHAAGLAYYNTELAKDQVRAMFDFQRKDGFIVDCIYRDTTIEPHNYRDTKPPLAVWAVNRIFQQDGDLSFVRELYPKLKKYHSWWYVQRDHDGDGLCEYGSTDGSLIAAKWESGMDNAIRFDASQILKNSEGAYSLNQESVDLNSYLYAEKLYLAALAEALGKKEESITYRKEAKTLKQRIQDQFYDPADGWFYDTNLKGNTFIKGAGSEGWTALWAKAASLEQATAVKNKMMDPKKFFGRVPFQTMAMDHPKFDPMNGYWRGPNWLDQACFGVKGLRNYGFDQEANRATLQILEGAQGVMGKGMSIRENYHPISGQGLYAKNFSWSAAHIIMLLIED